MTRALSWCCVFLREEKGRQISLGFLAKLSIPSFFMVLMSKIFHRYTMQLQNDPCTTIVYCYKLSLIEMMYCKIIILRWRGYGRQRHTNIKRTRGNLFFFEHIRHSWKCNFSLLAIINRGFPTRYVARYVSCKFILYSLYE